MTAESRKDGFEPEIVVFACHYCAYAAADLAGSMRLQYPTNIKILRLPCSGALDIVYVLRALEQGADGVIVAGCLEGTCHFMEGNYRAKRRVKYIRDLLAQVGLEPERVEMFNMSSSEGPRFAEVAREMTQRIKGLGPSPVKRGSKP